MLPISRTFSTTSSRPHTLGYTSLYILKHRAQKRLNIFSGKTSYSFLTFSYSISNCQTRAQSNILSR
uniref:Uncharacterized protein n=1 Tax=Anguilla anguilla TaxID=7936 RepID=A0A0E9WT97_ANGAN